MKDDVFQRYGGCCWLRRGIRLVVMLTLSLLVLGSSISAAPRQREMLAPLFQKEADIRGSEDISRDVLLKILSELAVPRESDVLSVEDGLDLRNEVVRQLPLSQRERKAGCRNFFWKTFTSC
ncbi:somatostatin-1 [Brachyhypopomus gauderio]|uniref:somatostatin-1 n=1 Tax=Brachyhypopomus gauderio TaxID=698409 RepID=UPI0040416DD1